MPKNSEFTGTEIPAVNTKHNRAPMPVGGMPFGRFGANKKVNNNVFGGINSDLICRVVRDEKKDDKKDDKKDIDEKEKTDGGADKNTDTSTVDNSTNSNETEASISSDKISKKDDETSMKDIIELQKLMLLKEMGKDKKQGKKSDSSDSRFENDYPDIYHNRGNRLFDTIGSQWFINNDTTKQYELVKKINWLLSPTSDYVEQYNEREKTLKENYNAERDKHKEDLIKQGKDIKDGTKTGSGALEGDLQDLVNNFMKRLSYGEVDKKKQLTLSTGSMYKVSKSISDLADKLRKEIKEREANGKKLDQAAINERTKIVRMLDTLGFQCDLIGIDDVRHAIEDDSERVSQIYNGLNIFQRFWYALLDLIFGTNYNQEYSDIIAIHRLMIRELNLSDDEMDAEKHYKHILKFCDLSSKLDNVRENMASYLLYPDKNVTEEIVKFKQDALKLKRSADSIFTGLFEICGGKMMSQYISYNKKDKKRKYMSDLLTNSVQIKGVNPTKSQKKEIIDLALSGKSGEDINEKLNLIGDDDVDKDNKIDKLDYSVSSGALGSFVAMFTQKTLKEKGELWKAKAFGYLYLIEQKYVNDQIASYDKLFHETNNFLNKVVANNLANLINNAMLEDETGIAKGSYQMAKIKPFIIGRIELAYNELLKRADKFDIDDSKDAVYDDAIKHVNDELEKISSDKLTKEDKKAGKKPNTNLGKLKQDKFEEMYMLKELITKMKSTNKMSKEYYNKVKGFIEVNRKQLVSNIEEIFAQFKQKSNLINAWQAHEKNDDKHLNVYKEVENTKSKYDGRHYKDMKEVAQGKGGRGGFHGMGGVF